jgi:hypothetical protein
MMGVNFDGMTDSERTQNVSPELREEANKLYWSLMGVGWPLQAIFGTVLVAPYPSAVWLIVFGVKRYKRGSNSELT